MIRRAARRGWTARASIGAILAVGVALAGCTAAADRHETASSKNAASRSAVASQSGTLTIYAASSLTAAFEALSAMLEREAPNLTVNLVSDGSSTLAVQIEHGAPADVFASADETTMNAVVEKGLLNDPSLFAANTLRIAVAPGNPLGIETLADLSAPGVLTALCAPLVPCGAASATLLANAGVSLTPASEEQNVSAVVTRVAEKQVDAGLVYATDVAANPGRIDGIEPAGAGAVVNRYPIGVVSGTLNAAAAQAFVDLVLSARGQTELAKHGFLAPGAGVG